MKNQIKFCAIITIAFATISCGSNTGSKVEEKSANSDVQVKVEEPVANYVTDIDGNKYKIVTIGKQTWMAENLRVTKFRNGDLIPQIQDANVWTNLETGAWCYYANNSENDQKYGKLYNFYSVKDQRGLAPEGWHIPTDQEWTDLAMFLGGSDVAGEKMKDQNGFAAIYSGFCDDSGESDFLGEAGAWWSTLPNNHTVWCRGVTSADGKLQRESESFYFEAGISVRCIKNN
jgi:uncharacterized protein (TIGR02145 family)